MMTTGIGQLQALDIPYWLVGIRSGFLEASLNGMQSKERKVGFSMAMYCGNTIRNTWHGNEQWLLVVQRIGRSSRLYTKKIEKIKITAYT
jgi:hypothetical protein